MSDSLAVQPNSSHPCGFSQPVWTGIKILTAIAMIASIGIAIAGGAGWLPSAAFYTALAVGFASVILAIALCCCSCFNFLINQAAHSNQDIPEVDHGTPHDDQNTHLDQENLNISDSVLRDVVDSNNAGPSNRLLSFYTTNGADSEARWFPQTLLMDHERLESCDNYIQWLFPLFRASIRYPHIPVLTQDILEPLRASPNARQNMKNAFFIMLRFYGLHPSGEPESESYRIERWGVGMHSWSTRSQVWLTPNNHNFRRIARILESMKIMHFDREVAAFLAILEQIAQEAGAGIVDNGTLERWRSAATG